MAMNNEFQLIGTLSATPSYDTTRDTPVCLMQVAVKSFYKDKETGKTSDKTQFHFIRAYGAKGENAHKYLIKGQGVMVKGHVHSWYDRANNDGGMFLVCDEIVYGKKPKTTASEEPNGDAEHSNHAPSSLDDDDIPF